MTEQKPESELQLEELISLVESPVPDLKEFVRENNLSDDEIKRLLKAEQSAKNRKTATDYLKRQLEDHNHPQIVEERKLGDLKVVEDEDGETRFVADIQGIKFDLERMPMLNLAGHQFELAPEQGEHVEGVSHVGRAPVSQSPVAEAANHLRGGQPQPAQRTATVQNTARQQPQRTGAPIGNQRQQPPQATNQRTQTTPQTLPREPNRQPKPETANRTQSQNKGNRETDSSDEEIDQAINDIIEGEQQKLKEELKNEYGLEEEDLEGKTASELKELKSKLEQKRDKKQDLKDRFGVDEERLEGKSLEELHKLEKELEDVENKRQEVLGKYDISEAEVEDKNLEELRELEENLKEREQKRKKLKDKYDVDPEELQGKDIDELENFEERLDNRQKLAAELATYGYSSGDLEGKDLDQLHDMIDEIKEKKELMDELGVEMDDTKLNEITLEQLKDLKQEKTERQELISELKEHGVNEEMLRKSSNSDLRKLKSEIESQKEQQQENKEDNTGEDEERTEEEIKKEAEEDLHMLMGAVEERDEEEEDDGNFMEYFDLKSEFSEKWEKLRGNDDEEDGDKESKYEKVIGLLESYREMERRESAIKTAQVLKGYLEYLLEIDRELTYAELAESLESLDNRDENIETLIEFFNAMDESYRGEVRVNNVDDVIDTAEKVINDLR
jgi:hypothetical protein